VIVQKKGGGCFKWIGIAAVAFVALIVIAIIAAVAGGGGSTKSENSSGAAAAPHAIGETAHSGDFDVTLNAATNPYVDPNQFAQPPDGHHYLAVDVTILNTSDRDLTVSSLLFFDLVDAGGTVQQIAPIAGTDIPGIDGPVAAHDVRRGFVVFDVIDTAVAPLKLRVKGDITAGGVTFTIP
jgi:hypothetical protein